MSGRRGRSRSSSRSPARHRESRRRDGSHDDHHRRGHEREHKDHKRRSRSRSRSPGLARSSQMSSRELARRQIRSRSPPTRQDVSPERRSGRGYRPRSPVLQPPPPPPRQQLLDHPPPLWSIHKGTTHTIKPFGMFISIPGYKRHVLVHHTQIHEEIRFSKEDADEDKVKGMEFFFPRGQAVWVKVTEAGSGDGAKVCGSMLVVNQDTGQDLDPDNKMIRTGGGGGGRGPLSDGAPEVGTVLKGTVKRIEPYGVFVAMQGYRKFGLVHSSQVSNYLSFNREDTDEDKKAELVVEVTEDDGSGRGPKIQCSIKLVDQTSGEDLDPLMTRYKPRATGEGGRGGMGRIGSEAGEIVGGKINWGHLAGDAKLHAGDHAGQYQLLGAAPGEQAGPARPAPPPSNYELKPQGLAPGEMLLPPPPPFLPPPPPRQILTVEDALAVLEQDAKNKSKKKDKKKKKSKSKKSKKSKSKSKKSKHSSDSSSSDSGSSDGAG